MKLAKRILFGAMAALALVGCKDDKLAPDSPGSGSNGKEERDGVFMSVNIKMPTSGGSRSFTSGDNESNSGTEIGKDRENNVNTVYLVLAKYSATDEAVNNTFIAWGEIPAASIHKSTDGVQYNATANFSKSELEFYYGNLAEGELTEVNVYVFCNPTLKLRYILEAEAEKTPVEKAKKEWIDASGNFDASNPTAEVIWSDNNFLMSNSEIAIRSLPKTLAEWDPYTDESKPFDLSGANSDTPGCDNSSDAVYPRGAVRVERTAARLDFKDGSNNNNTYEVLSPEEDLLNLDGQNIGKPCLVYVTLNKMSLTNMSKTFYYLRRVSNNGLPEITEGNDYKICGPEKPWFTDNNGSLILDKVGNYIVSPLATDMANIPLADNFSFLNFNYPFFSEEGEIEPATINAWSTSVINDVLGNEGDNYVQKDEEGNTVIDKEYHIWRYVTENTIPGVKPQKNGQSTGIVFKGRITANDICYTVEDQNIRDLAHYLNNTPLTENGEKPLTGNLDKDPIIYKFTGVRNNIGGMYATWPYVEQEAKERAIVPVWEADNTTEGGYWRLEINRSETLYKAVFGVDGSCISYTFKDSNGVEHTVEDPNGKSYLPGSAAEAWHKWDDAGKPVPQTDQDVENLDLYYNFKKTAVANGFWLYQTSYDGADEEYGYYCYYYYWNRHNDNGQNSIMSPMEFAVVRNNVYKIAVTKISNIGHPRVTINDPNPPTPNTDDEVDDVYINVDVNVLPWVVRINNVEF